MSVGRLFPENTTRKETIQAFATGNFSPATLGDLQNNNAASIVKHLPLHTNFITLSPDIMALDQGKLCGIFLALPSHVKVVNFMFGSLTPEQLPQFLGLLYHSNYAKDVNVFNLSLNFDTIPLATLNNRAITRTFPRQLSALNVTNEGQQAVAQEDVDLFCDKVAAKTKVCFEDGETCKQAMRVCR